MKMKLTAAMAAIAVGIVLLLLPCCKKEDNKETPVTPEPEPEKVAVESVKIDFEGDKIRLFTGTSYTISATVEPQNATDKSLTWAVDDPEIASIDENGNISALKSGDAVVTVSAGEKNATVNVHITQAEFSQSSLEMYPNQESYLSDYFVGNEWPFANYSLYSSDESVVKVNSMTHTITAVSEGTAVITAKYNSGDAPKYQTAPNMIMEVTVKDPFIADVTDCFSVTSRGVVLTASITGGTVHVGDKVRLLQPTDANGNYIVTVNALEMNKKSVDSATKGDTPDILLGKQVDKNKLQVGAVLMSDAAADLIVPASKIYGSIKVTKRIYEDSSAQFYSHGCNVTGTFTYLDGYSYYGPEMTTGSIEVAIAEGYKLICNKGQKINFSVDGNQIGTFTIKSYDAADVKYEDVSQ